MRLPLGPRSCQLPPRFAACLRGRGLVKPPKIPRQSPAVPAIEISPAVLKRVIAATSGTERAAPHPPSGDPPKKWASVLPAGAGGGVTADHARDLIATGCCDAVLQPKCMLFPRRL